MAAALSLVREGERRRIPIRIIGSCAVILLTGADAGQRPRPPKDIDFIALGSLRQGTQGAFTACGWTLDLSRLLEFDTREFFTRSDSRLAAEVFYDVIDGNHPTNVSATIRASYPTLNWAMLLISKLQRRNLRECDAWDIVQLINMSVNAREAQMFVASLAADWGLFTTVTDNLRRIERSYAMCRPATQRLLASAHNINKSLRWRLRAIIGRRLPWYRRITQSSDQ
jgi:hypothetical protein